MSQSVDDRIYRLQQELLLVRSEEQTSRGTFPLTKIEKEKEIHQNDTEEFLNNHFNVLRPRQNYSLRKYVIVRCRSRSPSFERYKPRRSKSPKKSSKYSIRYRSRSREQKDFTHISRIDSGLWLRHFSVFKNDILKLFEEKKLIEFTFGKESQIILDKHNVLDLAKLYDKKDNLCTSCYHGCNLHRRTLICKDCLINYPDANCHGSAPDCQKMKLINRTTYSLYMYCASCEH